MGRPVIGHPGPGATIVTCMMTDPAVRLAKVGVIIIPHIHTPQCFHTSTHHDQHHTGENQCFSGSSGAHQGDEVPVEGRVVPPGQPLQADAKPHVFSLHPVHVPADCQELQQHGGSNHSLVVLYYTIIVY